LISGQANSTGLDSFFHLAFNPPSGKGDADIIPRLYLGAASNDSPIFLLDNTVSPAKNCQGTDGMQEAGVFFKGGPLALLVAKHGLNQSSAQLMNPLPVIFQALFRGMAGKCLTESG